MKKNKKYICCMCGRVFEGYGNNPEGAVWRCLDGTVEYPTFKEEDRCCDECNQRYVVLGRLYRAGLLKKK